MRIRIVRSIRLTLNLGRSYVGSNKIALQIISKSTIGACDNRLTKLAISGEETEEEKRGRTGTGERRRRKEKRGGTKATGRGETARNGKEQKGR